MLSLLRGTYWNRELKSQDDEGETYACWRDGNLFSRRHRPGSKRRVAGQRRLAPFDLRPSERPKNQKCQRPNAMVGSRRSQGVCGIIVHKSGTAITYLYNRTRPSGTLDWSFWMRGL